jgi:RND family efflux transporter MFP subunit
MNQDQRIDRLRIDPDRRDAEAGRPGWLWPVLLVLVLALAAAGWWLTQPDRIEVRVVQAALAQPGAPGAARASVLDASGYVIARRQATVAAEVTGKLVEVNVEEGLQVEQGQVLARIDDATEQAQLALARARLEATRSGLVETEAQLANAERTRYRQRELLDRELTSEAELDRAETEVEALAARLANQRRQVNVVEREIELQQRRLEQLTIRAPFSGIVIARAAQAGEMVSPISAGGGFTRTGICTIVDMDSLEIEVDVNEAYIDRVSAGQAVVARLDAYPDWEIPAEVMAVVPAADRQKATVRVRVALLERDSRILPEMGISVRFLDAPLDAAPEHAEARAVPQVPASAIERRDGRDVVWLLVGETVDGVLISAGLSGNELLVADPAGLNLSDGAPVRVIDP